MPSVNESLSLMRKFAPASIAALRGDVPNELLKAGVVLGDESATAEAVDQPEAALSSLPASIIAEAKIASAGLAVASDLCARCIPIIIKRLRMSKSLHLVSQVIVAVASVSLLVTLAKEYAWINYSLAALSLAAAATGIIGSQILSTLNPEVPDLSNAFGRLVADSFDASQCRARLTVLMQTAPTSSELGNLIEKSNTICRDVYVLASAIGISPTTS